MKICYISCEATPKALHVRWSFTMGTGIRYRYEARARMKGRYGTGEKPYPLTSLIKTIDGEFSDRQRNVNHNYAYTRLQQI